MLEVLLNSIVLDMVRNRDCVIVKLVNFGDRGHHTVLARLHVAMEHIIDPDCVPVEN